MSVFGRMSQFSRAFLSTSSIRRRGAVLLLAGAAATSVWAQDDVRASIGGRIVDEQGIALPGVTVTAQSADVPGSKTAVSDADGNYRLTALPPGRNYSVAGELSGFSRFLRSGIDLHQNPSATVDIQLRIGALSETIQVLGEEVSRSRNRVERLHDIPLSVSVVTGQELERLQATDISALTQRAANISWNWGNQRTSSLSIRGVGKQGQTEAQDPSVGIIVDGVNYAYNALSSSYDFTDVDTVEVTRGPQGTLLGKNTSLGVVNVTTRRPGFTPSADLALTVGENDTLLGRVGAGGSVIDNVLAWRGTLSVSKGAGDIKNLYNQDITYTNKDRVSGRVQLLLIASPSFNARAAVDAQPRGGETYNGRTINTPTPTRFADGSVNPLTTDALTRLTRRWFAQQGSYTYEGSYLYGAGQDAVYNDNQRPLVTGSNGASIELNWNLGHHTLTSITAYKNYHFNATNDDGTPFDIYRNSGGFWNDYRQATQEVRLTSRLGSFVDYQAGVFFIDVDNDVDYRREWGNDAGAWFASPAQYTRLDATADGRYLLQQSLDRLSMSFNSPAGVQAITNKSSAVFAQANWHVSGPLTVTTGLRFTREDRRNTASTLVKDYGNAPELNPAAVNGVALGGFSSDAAGLLAASNSTAQLSLADTVASKYFGVVATSVPGAAYNGLTAAQKRQVADAKTLRQAQIGVLFNTTEAEPYQAVQPSFVFSPTYKINPNVNTYVSLQYGEKAGIAQFTNGISNLALAEKTTAYEWGLKSVLFDKRLVVNADVFLMDSKNYQQAVRVLDLYTTKLNNDGLNYYTTATGNVPKVQVKGLELDGAYGGIRNTTIRFSGAYNDARYKEFPNSAQPVENGFTGAAPYQNVTGQLLPGASKWSFNVGVDVRIPVLGDKEFHTSFNTAYNSTYNVDVSLSQYAWIPAHSVTDFDIGLGKRNQKFNLSLLVRNLFNDQTPITLSWNSYTPAFHRWVGVVFTGKL
jgi:iron complex outermembrane recepter protein